MNLVCNLTPEVRDILKILWKRGEIAPKEQFLFSTVFCYQFLDLKRLFDISEVEITRVDCIYRIRFLREPVSSGMQGFLTFMAKQYGGRILMRVKKKKKKKKKKILYQPPNPTPHPNIDSSHMYKPEFILLPVCVSHLVELKRC